MRLVDNAILYAGILFFGMMMLLEIGRRIGLRKLARDAEGARQGLTAVEGAVFGLLGLLIAFTFSGAASRFEARRQLVLEEANDIGTAYLRIDLLPAGTQPGLRELFRQYVDARLEAYQKLPDVAAFKIELERGTKLQDQIWTYAINASRDSGSTLAPILLLPAINAMIDITNTRKAAKQSHPPTIIFIMLAVLALATSLLAGFGMAGSKARSWIHIVSFSAIITITAFVIVDLEYPRLGLIRVDAADQMLIDVRQTMN